MAFHAQLPAPLQQRRRHLHRCDDRALVRSFCLPGLHRRVSALEAGRGRLRARRVARGAADLPAVLAVDSGAHGVHGIVARHPQAAGLSDSHRRAVHSRSRAARFDFGIEMLLLLDRCCRRPAVESAHPAVGAARVAAVRGVQSLVLGRYPRSAGSSAGAQASARDRRVPVCSRRGASAIAGGSRSARPFAPGVLRRSLAVLALDCGGAAGARRIHLAERWRCCWAWTAAAFVFGRWQFERGLKFDPGRSRRQERSHRAIGQPPGMVVPAAGRVVPRSARRAGRKRTAIPEPRAPLPPGVPDGLLVRSADLGAHGVRTRRRTRNH